MSVPGAVGQRLDIGSGQSISIAELAGFVATHYRAPEPQICGLFRNGDVRHAACSPENAMKVLSWRPLVMTSEGIPRLCDWLDQQVGNEAGAKA
jgi:dTDP-L-rhamnose 4-epimerase